MKKKLIYIISGIIIILGLLGLYNVTKKTKIENIYNSLVRIEAYDDSSISYGFGFVYKVANDKSYIVTNYHVIENYFNIYIYDTNNKKTVAKLVNYDINNDIAVLSIDSLSNLKEVTVETNEIKINDIVYIIGNPSNTKNFKSTQKGKIINNETNFSGIYDFKPITISSNVDYGNSGSPVINKDGKIIGMVFLMKEDSKKICLTIPINYIVNFINDNKLDEDKPSLGAVMANSSNIEILKKYNINSIDIDGVVILKLSDKSILKKNKLKVGDVITKFNGVKISNINILKEELYDASIGDIVDIEYYRDASYNIITLKL